MTKDQRITPAGAGKTCLTAPKRTKRWDHPRRCGENSSDPACCSSIKGSPPQVRGKHSVKGSACFVSRITPAGAGKTALQGSELPNPQDHPRRCGENIAACNVNGSAVGSPPQVRGKRKVKPEWVDVIRDHPRRCGENGATVPPVGSAMGSPPQVRGKRRHDERTGASRRITPAGAGKTFKSAHSASKSKDHPRRCGENCKYRETEGVKWGSPPQVRGKQTTKSNP